MLPETYNFQTIVTGDLYPLTTFTFTDSNNDPIDFTGATASIVFRKNAQCEEPTINITDPTAGVIEIPVFTIDWYPGTWTYQLKVTLADLTVQTYLQGTLTVRETIECLSP